MSFRSTWLVPLFVAVVGACGGVPNNNAPPCGPGGACAPGTACGIDGRCRAASPADLAIPRRDGAVDLAAPVAADLAAGPDLGSPPDLVLGPDLTRGCGPCADPTPLCDPDSGQCVPCLAQRDLCPVGSYCEKTLQGFRCLQGCKSDPDCRQQNPNATKPFCCNRACVDLATDRLNCGVCGQGCGNRGCCGGVCSDPLTDLQHCGACGRPCMGGNAAWVCSAGACAITGCAPGFADCNKVANDGCEADTRRDDANCGLCGNKCSRPNGSGSCMAGNCSFKCDPGFADCNRDVADGCEVNTENSVQNCGACGNSCKPPANGAAGCKKGLCAVGACLPGFDDCDLDAANGCEIAVGSDIRNCGACGNVCKPGPNGMVMCMNGACVGVCGGAFKDCNNNLADGCEVNVDTDVNHCGGCNLRCNLANAVARCAGGCLIQSCSAGFADCDNAPGNGCEVNLGSDAKHCGGCGKVCGNGQSCVNSVCVVGGCFSLQDVAQIGLMKPQYTSCEQVQNGGLTCINPLIRYGNVPGGVPAKHGGNNFDIWCRQLGCKGYLANSVVYGNRSYAAPFGKLFGCAQYDDNVWHWCDWQDGNWYNQRLDYHVANDNEAITAITCF